MKQLIIFGSGDYAKMIFHELKKDKKYKILGFFDERKKTRFFKIKSKIKFIYLDQKIKKLKKIYGIIAVGDNYKRYKIYKSILKTLPNMNWIIYRSKSSIISSNVKIGKGSVILQNAVINSGTKIGEHCIINTSCSVDHDNIFEDFSSTGPRVTTAGKVNTKKFSFIGISTTINSKITIQKNTIIGGNSFVSKNCSSNSVYFGIPAKFIRKRKLGEKYLN